MRKASVFALFLIAALSCRGPEGLQTNNLSYLYNDQEMALRPHFRFEYQSDTLCVVHYRLETGNFLFTRLSDDKTYEAHVHINYQLLPRMENVEVLDSGSIAIHHQVLDVSNKVISGSFELKLPPENKSPEKLTLYVSTKDKNRGSEQSNFILLPRGNLNNPNNFNLRDTSGNVLFTNHLPAGVHFRLEHNLLQPKYFYVSFYRREFPLALPPYSSKGSQSFDIDPDTTFLVPADSVLAFKAEGFYHFRLDTSQWSGFTMYSFYQHFPMVGTHQDMAGPLRYLTTQSEYNDLLALMDKPEKLRNWIDDFWIRKAGNAQRAREMVRGFYERVESANRFFSSYHEGWKTDRGILYIIYGPPNKVYRSSAGEAWVYGNESSGLSYYFNFIRLDNPFSDNDFELDRSPQYRYGWGQAIEAWRRGHIYNTKDIRREQDDYDQLQYRTRTPMWY